MPPSAPLRQRALRSMAWALSGQVGQQIVRLGVTLALSRLLTPNDFGLVAVVGTITSFASVFTEAGVSAALIQRKDLARTHIASAAWLTLVLGVVLAGLTVACSGLIAHAFHEHALRALSIGFAGDFLVTAPGTVGKALLSRDLRFRRLVGAEIAGTVVGGAAAVVQAALHPSPWPMVTFLIVADGVTTLVVLAAVRYPVALVPDRSALRDLWRFSGGLLGYTAFNYWSRNADNVLIGRVLGTQALGIYSRAYTILLFPVQQVAAIVNRVMFPAMSSVQDDHARVRAAYLRTVGVVGLVVFPVTAFLAASAHELVVGVLGEPWRAAVPVVRVFAAVAALQSIGTTTGWLYQVTGHTARMFRVTVVLTVLVIGGFVIGVQFGLMGVVWSYLIWTGISLPANVVYGGRGLGLTARRVGAAIAPTFVLSGVLWALLVAIRAELTSLPPLGALGILVGATVAIYAAGVAVVRPAAWTELRRALADARAVPVSTETVEVVA